LADVVLLVRLQNHLLGLFGLQAANGRVEDFLLDERALRGSVSRSVAFIVTHLRKVT